MVHSKPAHHGFTLIELVTVMSMLGIVAALALPRWSPSDSTVVTQAQRLARDLRHAQSLALSQGRRLNFQLQSASNYRVTDSSGTTVTDPATSAPFSVTLENSVTLAGNDLAFDSLGRPLNAGSLASSARTYTLSGASRTASVTVSAVTGFTTVSP
jgi:type II secretion system protein H